MKTLDAKLAQLAADPGSRTFILADAKDGDMAYGMAAPGQSPEQHGSELFRSLADYRQSIRDNVQQGLIDIMLMSASTNEQLTIRERLFDCAAVTPAARGNDTSEIHAIKGGVYPRHPSRPFRSATIDHILCGKVDCAADERNMGADLCLYSVTFNNDVDRDLEVLRRYRDFRIEAERKGMRHFLEVFNPNNCGDHCPTDLGRFINDSIARTLGGVVGKGRPIFLKVPYNGPAAMEQLVSYDTSMVVGILGGAAGTTFDAFYQLREARKHGARAALYGRMINNAEHQPSFIQHLRWLADGELDDPAQAVHSYHAALEKQGVRPYRSLDDDLTPMRMAEVATPKKSKSMAMVSGGRDAMAPNAAGDGEPDFASMSPAEKVKWNLARWNRVLG